MQTKVVQAFTPQDLKAQLDLIIAVDTPTFISVVEMLSARGSYVIIWLP